VSFRNHNEFHEQCVERIFMDLWTRCKPIKLTVYARYTRRGGLDINPWRTSHPQATAGRTCAPRGSEVFQGVVGLVIHMPLLDALQFFEGHWNLPARRGLQ
jgi:hypothetical protein